MKIAIVIPSHDQSPHRFAVSLANLCLYTGARLLDEGVYCGVLSVSGTYVHQARQELANAALEAGVDYLLWLDADMSFPQDALERLLKHRVDVVGINYAARGVPSHFVAIKKAGLASEGGRRLQTLPESTGLEEVDGLGFGCVLMKASALQKLPDPTETPWFQHVRRDGHWMGEDIFFCELLRQAGVRIFVDHDLSKECGHVGSLEYTLEHAQAEVEEVAA